MKLFLPLVALLGLLALTSAQYFEAPLSSFRNFEDFPEVALADAGSDEDSDEISLASGETKQNLPSCRSEKIIAARAKGKNPKCDRGIDPGFIRRPQVGSKNVKACALVDKNLKAMAKNRATITCVNKLGQTVNLP